MYQRSAYCVAEHRRADNLLVNRPACDSYVAAGSQPRRAADQRELERRGSARHAMRDL